MQNIDAMIWLLIPLIGMVLGLLLNRLRANNSGSKRRMVIGPVITAAIVVTYVFLRYVAFPA
jgi:hypothetical protein